MWLVTASQPITAQDSQCQQLFNVVLQRERENASFTGISSSTNQSLLTRNITWSHLQTGKLCKRFTFRILEKLTDFSWMTKITTQSVIIRDSVISDDIIRDSGISDDVIRDSGISDDIIRHGKYSLNKNNKKQIIFVLLPVWFWVLAES